MTVAELGQRMSSHEFAEWMAYYGIEPFGEERADLRQAMTTSAVHNSIQVHAKNPKWTKPGDFMPYSTKEEEQPKSTAPAPAVSPNALMAKFNALTNRKKG